MHRRIVSGFLALVCTCLSAGGATQGTALVRHAPSINGTVDGSVQQLSGESATLNGGGYITGDWLVSGTPTVRLNGNPIFGGTLAGGGATIPDSYTVTLNGSASLGHLRTRTDPLALPDVAAPAAPTGTRAVTLNGAGEAAGDFATIRNLTLNGDAGERVVPAGTYGDFIANGNSGFTLGVPGALQPAVYAFQHLTLNGNGALRIVGPVIITVANGFAANAAMGAESNPEWLSLRIVSGDFTLNGNVAVYGYVLAPSSGVVINGNSTLVGGVTSDRLTLNGGGTLKLIDRLPTGALIAPADSTIVRAPASAITLAASTADADGVIAKVEFFAGANKLGERTAPDAVGGATYSFACPFPTPGTFALTATLTDNAGGTTISAPVTIIVDAPPTIAFAAPIDGAVVTAPAEVALQVNAADADGTVAKVEFFQGTTKIGESTVAPFTFNWQNVPHGQSSLTAIATDNLGLSTTSAPVVIVVNQPPAAVLTAPAAGTILIAPASTMLAAAATDVDGTVAKVEFYSGTTKLGEVTSPSPAPSTFALPVTFSLPGVYDLVAVATDNRGAVTHSAATTVKVDAPPVVAFTAPADGAIVIAPNAVQLAANAADSDGTVAKVEFFQGSTSVGVATAAPYQCTVSGLAPGRYTFSAKATDDIGATAVAAPVSIIVDAPPTVRLMAPVDGAVLAASGSIKLEAAAADADGAIGKVEFFSGATKLGETAVAPYQFDWPGVAVGTYTLTARATDNLGATTVSSTVAITVDTPPTAKGQTLAVDAGTPLAITLAGTDVDGDALTYAVVTPPAHGTVTGTPPALSYVAESTYAGDDSLAFTVSDGHFTSGAAMISIAVRSSNQQPVVNAGPDQVVTYTAPASGKPKGKIIVHNDEWAFTNAAYSNAPASTPNFVRNVARWFTGGRPGRFLAFATTIPGSVEFSYTESQVAAQMAALGHTWVVSHASTLTLAEMRQYDAVFLAANSVDNQALIDYVEGGGAVYVGSGTRSAGDIPNEGVLWWGKFLNHFGIGYAAGYNGIVATVPVVLTDNPLLEGVEALYNGNGNDVYKFDPNDPSSIIVWRAQGHNLLASYGVDGNTNTFFLGGSATDDGRPSGTLSYHWILVSGPAPVEFATPDVALTRATYTVAGTYRFRLDVSDGQKTGGAETTVVVNERPRVNAGPARWAGLNQYIRMSGAVSDDGVPALLTSTWTVVGGPGGVNFEDAANPNTRAAFDAPGLYVLKLAATDGNLDASDTVEVRVGQPNSIPRPASLVAWWPGNYTPMDTVAGLDAQLGKGAAYDIGVVGGAFQFDGVDDYWRVRAHPNIDLGASAAGFSIEFWMKPQTASATVLQWRTVADQFGASIALSPYLGSNRLALRFQDKAGQPHQIFVESFYEVGVWQHVMVTYDKVSGVLRAYRDGRLRLEQAIGTFSLQTGYDLFIGDPPPATGGFFKGNIDEISLYSRPLSPSDAYDQFTAGAVGKVPFDSNVRPTVRAGSNFVLRAAGDAAVLNGSVNDDGLPADTRLTIAWSQASGPAAVVFSATDIAAPTATFPATGTYVLKLSASDGAQIASDTVEVRVGVQMVPFPAQAVAWWPGNDTTRDVVGGLDAVWISGPSYGQGKVGDAFQFDGVHRLQVGASPVMAADAWSGFTVEWWMKPSGMTSGGAGLLEWRRTDGITGVSIGMDLAYGGRLNVDLADTAGRSHQFNIGNFISQDVWQHVAVTYDRATGMARAYRNGVLRSEVSLGSFTPQTTYDLKLGLPQTNGSPFKGALDEIALFQRALTPAEIAGIYNADANGKCSILEYTGPSVDAGSDVVLADTSRVATLVGVVSDRIEPLGAPLVRWTVVSGPGSVTFADPNSATTTATFSATGTYLLQVTANDGVVAPVSDLVEVRVGAATAALPNGIAAWWPGNGSPIEVVHGNHDMQLLNGAAYGDGKVLQAFSFGGGNNYATVRGDPELDIGTSASGLSIEFWARPTGMSGGGAGLIEWRRSDDVTGVSIGMNTSYGGQCNVDLKDVSGQSHTLSFSGITQDTWQHLVVTYDRATGMARGYRNAVRCAEASLGSFTPQTTYDLKLGLAQTNGTPFKGALDEITLYRRALTVAEITAIYNAGANGKCPVIDNTPPIVDAGPDLAIASTQAVATLAGTVSDDNKPLGAPTSQWAMVTGPGQVTYANPSAAATTATFTTAGTYLLRLTATDGLVAPVSDLVEVRVGAATAALPSGIAAWWSANGHPHELIHGGHDVDLLNGAAYGDGKVLQAFSFAGGNNYATVRGDPELDIGTSPSGLSIEFWARPTGMSNGGAGLIEWRRSGDVTGVSIGMNTSYGGQCNIDLKDVSGQSHTVSFSGITQDTWQHLVVTYDRTTGMARGYRNAVLCAEASLGSFTPLTSYDLRLGLPQTNGTPFKGALDEIAFYRRPLTSTEIVVIFKAGADGKCPLGNLPPVVDAGPNVILPDLNAVAMLNGSVSDDGQPSGLPSTQWSVVMGPGTAAFGDVKSAATSATFTAPGTYLLSLSAYDGLIAPVVDLTEVRVAASAVRSAPGLVAWWTANGHTREIVNGNADAELIQHATLAPGKVLEGFQFDGVDDYAATVAHPDVDLGASSSGFTVEFWAKPAQLRDGALISWGKQRVYGLTIGEAGYGRAISADLRDRSTGADHEFRTPDVLAAGQWTHIAVTQDRSSGQATIYVNGVAKASTTVGAFAVRTQYGLNFGRDAGGTDSYWSGALDEISLYNRPLTAAEIQAIFAAGVDGKLPLFNQAPLVNAGADGAGYINLPIALSGTATDDGLPNPPAALTYAWSKVSGPGNVTFTDATALNTSATFDAAGTYTIRLTANDSTLTGSADVQVTVTAPPSQPPVVSIYEPAANAKLPAATYFEVAARASDPDGTVAKVEFFQGTTKLGQQTAPAKDDPTTYFWPVTGGLPVGSYSFTAVVTDNTGMTVTSDPVNVSVVADVGPPVAEITTPDDPARITAPTAVTGIANSALLKSWTLEYRLKAPDKGKPESWTAFATGTSSVGTPAGNGTPATPGSFGSFDPTALLNGIYEIRLTVTDTAGRTVTAGPTMVIVEGNMKVGIFSLAFEDLKVPVAGVPITITRTYDSRDARVGDFGPGWRIAVANVRVQKNRKLGTGWWQTPQSGDGIQFYNVDPIGDRIVTIVMPDGETHRFKLGAYVKNREGDPDDASFAVVVKQGTLKFYPLGDTTSTLEPLDASNQLDAHFYIWGTGNQDLMTGDMTDLGAVPYDTSRFRLTTKDGTVMILDEVLGLLEMRDLNGNTLVLNRDTANRVTSVVSTLGSGPSAISSSVTIHRDTTGRVDYMKDPAGKELDYLYDAQGRLSSFTNRELNVTQFFYENTAFPYYLTKILDPRGVAALRSEYDTAGKLIKQIDAAGKETVFTHGTDPADRFEKVKDRLGKETTYYYDAHGNVTSKIDPLGAQTTFSYYADTDRVKLETDHYGNVKAFAYDDRGNAIVETIGADASEDPASPTKGYTTRTVYNALSAPTRIADPDGRLQTFTYGATTGALLSHTTGASATDATAGDKTTYGYYADGTLKSITDALGNVTTTTCNYSFSDAAYPGAVKEVTTSVSDPAGSLGSDPANASDTLLRSTRTLFDKQENQLAQIVTRHLPDGSSQDVITKYVYDSENRLRATILPDGAQGGSAGGRVNETRYTSFGKPSKSVQWQSVADYTAGDDAKARVTSYGYDTRGNQTSVTYPDGTFEEMAFDAENRKIWSQDRRGYRTFYTYDAVGRLRFTIFPDDKDGVGAAAPSDPTDARLADNPRAETQYDLIGRVTHTYDELGHHTETVYYPDGTADALRRKEEKRHVTLNSKPATLTTSYKYDRAGNVRYVTDPRGNTTETQYDDRGRPTFVIYPATDEHPVTRTETRYDALGRRIMAIDQEGKITRYRYDALGRLVQVRQYLDAATAAADTSSQLSATDSKLVATTYAYDEVGNLATQTDALGRVTTFWTDAMGRRTKRVLPKDATESASLSENLQYDDWGNLWKRTDFAGKTTVFGYDALNRLKSKTANTTHPSLAYSHAIARIEYDYDANGARTAARTYNASNTQLYTESTPRDERGRVKYKDTAGGRLDYSYFANGLLKDTVSSNSAGLNVGYRYDELNRLEHVDDATTATTLTSDYTYNPNGSLETLTQPNGVVHTYGYDALNRLRTLQVGRTVVGEPAFHSYEYKLNASGHRHQVIEGAKTTTYDYDALYRLTGETVAGVADAAQNGAVTYDLDKVGNRLSRSSGLSALSSQLSQTYNARDWLAGDSYNANGSTLTSSQLSALGSQLSGTDLYDFEERLIVRTKSDGTTINISYDADGIRIAKNILNASGTSVSSTSWLVDTNNLTGYAQVAEEVVTTAATSPSNPATTRRDVYTYGTSLLSRSETVNGEPGTDNLRHFVADGHGNIRELTDTTGAVTDRYTYDAFGNLVFKSGATSNIYLYCGEQFDPDLGLYFLRARYMNPDSGRFWSMDDFEGLTIDPFTLHKYIYGRGDPVRYTDPEGHLFGIGDPAATGFVVGVTARMAVPTIARITFVVIAAAISFSPSDPNIQKARDRKEVNSMRLQLQQGTDTHFWSQAYAYVEPRWVTKADIWNGLNAMWVAVDSNTTQEPFPGSAQAELGSAIVRMSKWVKDAGPLSGGIYTAHQEYAKSARIDLEQVSGTNFRLP